MSIFNRLIKQTGDSEKQEGDLFDTATLERIKRFNHTQVTIHGPNEVLVLLKQEVGIATSSGQGVVLDINDLTLSLL